MPQRNTIPPDSLQNAPSASNKGTHIRNKDGTKLITVPPRKPDATSSIPAPTAASAAAAPARPPASPAAQNELFNYSGPSLAGSRKKKKKKGKGVQHPPDHPSSFEFSAGRPNGSSAFHPDLEHVDDDLPELDEGDDDGEFTESEEPNEYDGAGDARSEVRASSVNSGLASQKKKKKKNKKKGAGEILAEPPHPVITRKNKDPIWNTSTAQERERIKDFWLSLGENERRSLVVVEKEAVLKKMKEQQKHSCSCTVCGRKRTAIEEELEVLYDAYYDELEQYANTQQSAKQIAHSPSPQRQLQPPSEDGIDDQDYDDGDEDDEVDYEGNGDMPDGRADFFTFGNSLTVQGGILTVADDLLKNDGKKFIEMMEQLAERRMAREEEASAAANGHSAVPMLSQHPHHNAHTHQPQPQEEFDDEDYEEEEDDDYDEDEEEDEEQDIMTEEQRMEEGRRMFQIFAARMFEQRVLTAYRQKVADERQARLLQELEDEDRKKQEQAERKAKEKDRKKEKKRLAKEAKEEEKMKKEAEKAAEEAKLKEAEQKKADELKKKKEEQRLKREAEKRAQEEEKHRKEEEKRRRLQEEKEREAERERKRKERLELERKKKEEVARKVREQKEQREKEAREAREAREKAERETKEREAKARKETAEKAEKARLQREAEAKTKIEAAQASKRVAVPLAPASIPTQPANFASPHLSVVTPAVPKKTGAPQARKASQQNSIQSSPRTPQVAFGSTSPPQQPTTPGSMAPPLKTTTSLHIPPNSGVPPSPMSHSIAPPPGVVPPQNNIFPNMLQPMGMNGPSPIEPMMNTFNRQSFGNGITGYPPSNGPPFSPNPQYRNFAPPSGLNGLPMGLSAPPGVRTMSQGPSQFQPPPGMPHPAPGSPFMGSGHPVPPTHTRSGSGSFESMGRPAPIGRPSSVAPPKEASSGHEDVEELSKIMGSRALLDDNVEPLPENNFNIGRRPSGIPFPAPKPTRTPVSAAAFFGNSEAAGYEHGVPMPARPGHTAFQYPHAIETNFRTHGGQPMPSWTNPAPLGAISSSLPTQWGSPSSFGNELYRTTASSVFPPPRPGWNDNGGMTRLNGRPPQRMDLIRVTAARMFQESHENEEIDLTLLLRYVNRHTSGTDGEELKNILSIEGDNQNGGGTFKLEHVNGRMPVQYVPNEGNTLHRGIGEIGSPSLASATPTFAARNIAPPPGMAPQVQQAGL